MRTLLSPYLEKRLTQRAKNAVNSTSQKSTAQPIDLLYALACEKGSLAKNILETHKITSAKITKCCPLSSSSKNKKPLLDKAFKEIIKRSAQIAFRHGQSFIGTEHLLSAIIRDAKHTPHVSRVLNDKTIAQIKKHLNTIFSQNISPLSLHNMIRGEQYKNIKGGATEKRVRIRHGAHTPALDSFCENLTALAQAQALDPVIGREKEISRIVNILSRRTKNNPLLIGEPGVGKTAIVQGLAQRINNGEVPGSLLRKNILSLNLNSVVAGTMFRGDFEARMRDIIKEASRGNIILFIDEMHTLIGAGSAQGSLDVANILKPALSKGNIQCIGATTIDEHRKHIEKDRALERRLQTVLIEEETEEQSISTLLRLKKLYEKHHEITIEDEAVEAAVRLSSRYIHDRFLPDKALDVLDEAASRLKSRAAIIEHTKKIRGLEMQKLSLKNDKEKAIAQENYRAAIVLKYREGMAEEEIKQFQKKFPLFDSKASLRKFDIEETVGEMAGIPIPKGGGVNELKRLSARLNKEIVGQKEAVAELIYAMKRSRAGLGSISRPTGSFLFLGPCGVGKTALAMALAEHNSQTLIRFDMSEYSEAHTISRLIGSPPGYVGYGESGELTEKIRRHPHAVVLFDEIEKAHPQVHNLLLSILENGALRDSEGRSVTFKNAIIILTSNAGFGEADEHNPLGFSKSDPSTPRQLADRSGQVTEKYLAEIKDALRPEIINRIDKIIVFQSLGRKEIFDIAKLFVGKLKKQLPHLNIALSEKVIEYIAQKSYKPREGARYIRSAIEQHIESPLAEYLLKHNNAKSVEIRVKNGKITVS